MFECGDRSVCRHCGEAIVMQRNGVWSCDSTRVHCEGTTRGLHEPATHAPTPDVYERLAEAADQDDLFHAEPTPLSKAARAVLAELSRIREDAGLRRQREAGQ